MTDTQDLIAKARAALERSVTREKMRKALDEREEIIERLLTKIEHMEWDVRAQACQVQRLKQRQRGWNGESVQ